VSYDLSTSLELEEGMYQCLLHTDKCVIVKTSFWFGYLRSYLCAFLVRL